MPQPSDQQWRREREAERRTEIDQEDVKRFAARVRDI
jgi:hypothetical protein